MLDETNPPPQIPPALRERYRFVREVGRGGMGVVLEVEDIRLERTVALKLSTHLTNEMARARFLREAQVAARIQHPHVIEVFDSGIVDGVPFLTMELVEGRALDEGARPADPEAVFFKVAEALEMIHKQGLVHRDVKPGNILLAGDRVLLTDFGLVHDPDQTALTRTGMLPGTVAFMAPEVLAGDLISPAADWWALGVALYEVVDRRLPYDVHDVMAFAGGEVKPAPPFRKVPESSRLARMARAWMAVDPTQRPATVDAMRRLLLEPRSGSSSGAVATERVAASLDQPSSRSGSRSSSQAAPPRDRRPFLLGLFGSLLGITLLAVLTRDGARPAPAATATPPPSQQPSDPFPAIPAAVATLRRDDVLEVIQDPDPWVWAKALTRYPELQALLPLLADPAARARLHEVDAELRSAGRPGLLRPHLEHEPARQPWPVEAFAQKRPFGGTALYWPERPGPHLSRAAAVAVRAVTAYEFLLADIRAAELGDPTSEDFPFPMFRSRVFAINGWDLAMGTLETRPDVRERAQEWFRPCTEAYRDMLAAITASLREEPESRGAAVLLANHVTGLLSRSFYSWLCVLESRWLFPQEPATPEAWALRTVLLRRQSWVARRGKRGYESIAREMLEAARHALEEPGTDLVGAWIRAHALERVAATAANGFPVPDLQDLTDRHLPAILEHAPRHVAELHIAELLKAAEDLPDLRPLSTEAARTCVKYLDRDPDYWERYKDKRRARWRTLLEELAR